MLKNKVLQIESEMNNLSNSKKLCHTPGNCMVPRVITVHIYVILDVKLR